jgi:hypothetical protein
VTRAERLFNAATARRAGISSSIAEMMIPHFEDAKWKADDRAWFERNPSRAHRLRRVFPGELTGDEARADHVIVRQVEPGWRVRAGFIRNLEICIPDTEPALHALFDLMTERRIVSEDELTELATKYAKAECVS